MPTAPLIDCSEFELDTVVVTREQIYQSCRQSGRFALLDGLLRFEPSGEIAVGLKRIAAGDWWASDHIRGRPIFPGVLMVEAAAQLCTYDFVHRRPELDHAFLGFAGLDSVRFRGIVEPPARMLFAAKVERLRETMFIYDTQGFVDRNLVFEAKIRGMVV